MNIFEYFKKKGIDTIDSSFYSKIAMWDSWYRANVKRFHQYRVYHGTGQYERCHRKSLGMAKKICEDISDLLLNERVTITIKDETTAKFVRSVLDAANFTVQGNEYQERKAACGTVAYVPYLTNMEVAEDGSVLSADIKLDYVVAKNIYPTAWENSRITEVIFAFPKTYKRKKYVQLQHHKLEPRQDKDGNDLGYQYVIENSVVECSSGAGRDLTPAEWNAIPYFEGLAARVETGSNQPQFIIDKLNIANNVDEDDTNYAKIVKAVKGYGRYTDDSYAIARTREKLLELLDGLEKEAKEYGLIINRKKTRIVKLSSEFRHLQVCYSLTETGRIIRKINPKNITRERRKLKAYKRLLDSGRIDYATVENAFKSWLGSHWKYMSHDQVYNMSSLYYELFGRRPKWKKGHGRLHWLMAHPSTASTSTGTTTSAPPPSPRPPSPVSSPA